MVAEYSFDEKKHIHKLGEKMLQGTTTVLNIIAKPALIPWAVNECVKYIETKCDYFDDEPNSFFKVSKEDLKNAKAAHRKKKESAADWGTIVHKAIEMWIKTQNKPTVVECGGEPYKLTDDQEHAVDSFIGWATKQNVEFILSEKGIYSKEWGVGGIVDFVCKIDGKIYVGDVKTSSAIYETHFLQTAAYAKMLLEMGLVDKVDKRVIVNLKKTGEFVVEERGDIPYDIKCYEAAILLHNRLK